MKGLANLVMSSMYYVYKLDKLNVPKTKGAVAMIYTKSLTNVAKDLKDQPTDIWIQML